MTMTEFDGKVAVITGGGSGIGAAICRALAGRGMKLAVVDIELAAAESVAGALREGGAQAIACRADVSSDESVAELASAVEAQFGACHLVVANAGVVLFGRLEERSRQDWDWVFSVNLFGPIRTVEAFLPLLRRNPDNAHIVMTASMAGLLAGSPAKGVYNASKHALMSYGETLREELAEEGIGVSLLLPGGVVSQIVDSGRNRHAAFGAAKPVSAADMELMLRGLGEREVPVEADYAVRNLISGIERNETWIITHNSPQRAKIEQRFAGIVEAFERSKR